MKYSLSLAAFAVALFFALFTPTTSQSIAVFAKCPNILRSFADIASAFKECAGLVQFGCQMLPCGVTGFSCRLPGTACPSPDSPLPGPSTKIEFDTLKVETDVSFFINLTTTKLPVDFYLLADATGSMSSAISTVKVRFNQIIDHFNSDPLVTNVRFGVGMYRDERELTNGFKNLQSMTANTATVKTAVNSLAASGGRDVDEANLVGLYRVATDASIGWNSGRRKILVYFGDYPGHEPTCGPYGKLTRQSVVAALKKKGITVIGMSLRSSFNNAPRVPFGCPRGTKAAGKGQTAFITSQTGGGAPVLSSATNLVSRIIDGLNGLSSTFSVDDSDCSGKITSTYDPTMPQTLPPGEAKKVKQTVRIPKKYCNTDGTSSSFTCQIRYIEDGVFMPPTDVVVKNVVGCP